MESVKRCRATHCDRGMSNLIDICSVSCCSLSSSLKKATNAKCISAIANRDSLSLSLCHTILPPPSIHQLKSISRLCSSSRPSRFEGGCHVVKLSRSPQLTTSYCIYGRAHIYVCSQHAVMVLIICTDRQNGECGNHRTSSS